uniref:F-box and WD repeat domain containing 7 n=1 Tax=Molossus molossus TaxID=27622 RepID=A0A7J8I7B5_MOLMO|nr:F-box and WD repeat domain containing 7 [Molossus molossus]
MRTPQETKKNQRKMKNVLGNRMRRMKRKRKWTRRVMILISLMTVAGKMNIHIVTVSQTPVVSRTCLFTNSPPHSIQRQQNTTGLVPCSATPTTFGDLRAANGQGQQRRRITSVQPPTGLQEWLKMFQSWSGPEKLLALDELIDSCEPTQVKHMMQVIEPQFQRDFISLLPKELALYVLSFLEPKDLLQAAQTCRYWRILAEDNLLWREKCKEEGIDEPLHIKRRKVIKPGFIHSPWKSAYIRQHRIDTNWRRGELKSPKVLKGHDDHVITCLQFCGNRIVSGSDDNTLKVWSAVTGKCLRTLVGHTGGVWSSQMRDNIIISGSTDRTLKVWNAETGECIHTLYGHTSTVRLVQDVGLGQQNEKTYRLRRKEEEMTNLTDKRGRCCLIT